MRLVVLLCGVIAGIVGLGFGWWGQPAGLVDIYRLPTPHFAMAVLAIHAISATSIAGGLLVLANPRVGGMMMLASATIWLLIVALLGGGLGLSMAALIGIGAGGGVLAFLPSLHRAAYRLERAHDDDEPRVIAARSPDLVAEREPDPAGEDPVREVERPAAYNWRGVIYDTTEDHSKPFEPPQWRFEEPDLGPVEVEPAPEPPPPPPREAPQPIDPQPRLSRFDRDEHRAAYEIHHGHIRPLTLKAARKKRSRGRTIAGLIALAAVVIGLPTLLVIDQQMRSAAGTQPPSPAVAAADTSVPPADPPLVREAADQQAPAAEPRLEAGKLPAFNELSIVPAEKAAAPAENFAELPMPPPAAVAYQTPFDYCADQRDVDAPERSLIAEGLPPELIAGVREVTNMPDGDVLWRCMGKKVWVCAQPAGGVECGKVPTPAERQAYCADHPDAADIAAAAGRWSCNGVVPVVPGGDQRTTDPRGYDRLAWLGLSKAAKRDST